MRKHFILHSIVNFTSFKSNFSDDSQYGNFPLKITVIIINVKQFGILFPIFLKVEYSVAIIDIKKNINKKIVFIQETENFQRLLDNYCCELYASFYLIDHLIDALSVINSKQVTSDNL